MVAFVHYHANIDSNYTNELFFFFLFRAQVPEYLFYNEISQLTFYFK
jgi:hypothetical protein